MVPTPYTVNTNHFLDTCLFNSPQLAQMLWKTEIFFCASCWHMDEVPVLHFDLTNQSVGLIWMDLTGLDAALWETLVSHSAAQPIVHTCKQTDQNCGTWAFLSVWSSELKVKSCTSLMNSYEHVQKAIFSVLSVGTNYFKSCARLPNKTNYSVKGLLLV